MKVFKSEKKKKALLEDYDRLLGQWGVPYEEKDIVNQFGSTHVILAGQCSFPPLVLLHGVGDNSAVMWIHNIRSLSACFRCIAVDTVGGPGKSVPGEAYNKNFSQREWIDSILDQLDIKTCFMMGVSNGAVMAFAYAAFSERVEKLICIEGGPILSSAVAYKTMLKAFPEILWPTEKNVKKLLIKLANPRQGFFEENPNISDHMVLIMKASNQIAMANHKLWIYDNKRAEKLRSKTLIIMGEYSGAKSVEIMQVLSSDGYKVQVIKDAGHGVNMEQFEILNDSAIAFLKH